MGNGLLRKHWLLPPIAADARTFLSLQSDTAKEANCLCRVSGALLNWHTLASSTILRFFPFGIVNNSARISANFSRRSHDS